MRSWMIVAAAGLALGGCSMQESRGKAETAVGAFHEQLNAGRFQDIYRATAPQFRNATTEERFVGILGLVHDRLGAFGQADQQAWHVNLNNGVTSVDLSYNSTFARGQATEHFVYIIGDSGAALVSYDVNSPALVGAGPTPAPAPANDAPAAPEGEGEGGK